MKGRDAGTERERREGVSEIVDHSYRLDPGGELCGLPLLWGLNGWRSIASSAIARKGTARSALK
jgi:hypothetical protein